MNNSELRTICRDKVVRGGYNSLTESERAEVEKAFKGGKTHANTAKISEIIKAREYSEFNKLSASEVLNRATEISIQLRTLRAYMLAYGRDWGEDMSFITEELDTLFDVYDDTMLLCKRVLTDMALTHHNKRRG